MQKIRLLLHFMKGKKLIYIGGIVAVGLAIMFAVITPLVLRVTIDSIIGNHPLDIPEQLRTIIHSLGGKSMLAQKLWLCGLLIVIFTMMRGLFLYLKGRWSAMAAEATAKNMREQLYDHLQHLHYDAHVKAKTGDLIQRCTSDVDTIRVFLATQFIEIGRAIFMLVFALNIMISLDLSMTLVCMAAVPVIFGFAFWFFIIVKKTFRKVDEAEAIMSTVLQENMTGVRVVRAFGRQRYEIDKFDIKNSTHRDSVYRLIRLMSWYWSISDFLCMVQSGVVLILGVYWASKGRISLGTLVVFTSYARMLLWPIRQLGQILTDMGKTFVALDRIEEILNQPVETAEQNEYKPMIKGEVTFRNVSFSYESGKSVLRNISFKVKRGQTIAILGPTGCGKTSLVHLLVRLYDYQKGSILIDGVELKKFNKKWLRKNVGIVLQEPFLFSKTIKENIRLSKLEAEEAEIFEAARIAFMHDAILDFEKGYETLVGERGVTLSGGQKQRIAIARTIINNCPILIFDDSLSAVDMETDLAIRKALKERSQHVTTFIISHRITTVSEADHILVLDEGKIVQSGTHDELIRQMGLYQRIWALQNSLEKELA